MEGMEQQDVHTQISAPKTPSMAMGDVENHKHLCWEGPTRTSPIPGAAQAWSVCPLRVVCAVRN